MPSLRLRSGTLRGNNTLRGRDGGIVVGAIGEAPVVSLKRLVNVTRRAVPPIPTVTDKRQVRFTRRVTAQIPPVTASRTVNIHVRVTIARPSVTAVAGTHTHFNTIQVLVSVSPPRVTVSLTTAAVVYIPPVQDVVPPVSLDPVEIAHNPLGYRLMRHYRTRARGVNVYQYEDGTYHQTQPWEGTVWSYDLHGNLTVTPPAHTVSHTYFGGHSEQVSAGTLAAIHAANDGAGQ